MITLCLQKSFSDSSLFSHIILGGTLLLLQLEIQSACRSEINLKTRLNVGGGNARYFSHNSVTIKLHNYLVEQFQSSFCFALVIVHNVQNHPFALVEKQCQKCQKF